MCVTLERVMLFLLSHVKLTKQEDMAAACRHMVRRTTRLWGRGRSGHFVSVS